MPQSSPRIYIGNFCFCYTKMIFHSLCQILIYLSANDTNIFCQHKDVTEIENVLIGEFANACDQFVDNKMISYHFGEDKTKCILFSRDKNLPELNITYKNNRMKQYIGELAKKRRLWKFANLRGGLTKKGVVFAMEVETPMHTMPKKIEFLI